MAETDINNPVGSIKGPKIEAQRVKSAETTGKTLVTTDQEVAHGHQSDAPIFGELEKRVVNGGNINKSREQVTRFDPSDTGTLSHAELKGLDRLGGETVTTTESYVDLTSSTTEDELSDQDLTLLSEKLTQVNETNAVSVVNRVDSWRPRTLTKHTDDNLFGATSNSTAQVIAVGTPVETGSNIIEVVDQQLDDAKMLRTVVRAENYVSDSEPIGTFTSFEEEPITGRRVTVERAIFLAEPATTADMSIARRTESVVQSSDNVWTRIRKTIDSSILTETFYEYHNVDFYFNSYLDPLVPFKVVSDLNTVSANKSGDQQLKVPARFEVTYHATAQGPDEIFQFKTVDLSYIDGDFRIEVPNIICDDGEIVLRKLNLITIGAGGFGGYNVSELPITTYSWRGSSPTATEYLDIMGEERLIADDTVRWKYDLWRRTKIYITLPDLTEEFGALTYEPYGSV